MNSQDFNKQKLPDLPGVYFFKKGSQVLYVGKATSLRDRVRSYFANDLIATRGPLLVDMVMKADKIDFGVTDSVLEALILEASLIKKYSPYYNTKEKDDKSFNWVVITKEDFPRVLTVRGRELEKGLSYEVKEKFGPFTQGNSLKEALRIIRKLFPYRDKCTPCISRNSALNPHNSAPARRSFSEGGSCRPCFNYQIGLCPGVCADLISKKNYNKTIHHLKYFLSGKKKTLMKELNKEMKSLAKDHKFEEADKIKRTIFALQHIQDVALIKKDDDTFSSSSLRGTKQSRLNNINNPDKGLDCFAKPRNDGGEGSTFRIEAYDVAHHAGSAEVGVMVASENGELTPGKYRLFNIKESKRDDLAALRETVTRRLNHPDWQLPNLIVVDGDQRQIKVVEQVLILLKKNIPVVSVVKDINHKAKAIIGSETFVKKYSKDILSINAESHRFAIQTHRRQLRKKLLQ